MKKSDFLKLLGILSIIFLTLQFVVLPLIFHRKENQDFVSNNHKKPPVSHFLDVAKAGNSPVFLCDPKILQILDGLPQDSVLDRVRLFADRKIVSFGIFENDWTVTQKDVFLGDLQAGGFYVHSINQLFDFTIQNATDDHVTTHYLLSKGGVVIHIVIFYTRSGGFLWHGSIEENDIHKSLVHKNDLKYWQHEGAFDKFSIKQELHFGKLLIPYPIQNFLYQVNISLFTPCNQTRTQQFLKSHPHDDSPEDQRFTRKSRQIIARAKQYLDDLEIPFWLSSGTCLGWFRQCDIITYSKDVDLGIFIKDYKPELVPTFERGGFFLHLVFGKVSDSYELSFQAGDIKLDLFFFYEESDYMWNGGTYDQTGQKYKYIFPKFSLSWTEFLGLKVRVPCPALPYIEANYGVNWSEPIKHWEWNKSPPNVRENGFWPKEEWDEVIQIY